MTDEWLLDSDLGEVLSENEIELAQELAASIATTVRQEYAKQAPPALRDAHPKAHGCVSAEFRIEDILPPNLAQGVFVPGKRYPAWSRFSNGDANAHRADAKGDVRGMAIKLLDVPGEKILEEDRDAPTQDFMMINTPVFLTDHVDRYLKAVERTHSSNPLVKLSALMALGSKGALIGLEVQSSHITNPLATRYWSTLPYRLGDPPHKQAIKFSAMPLTAMEMELPRHPDPNFLRQAMIEQLQASDAKFDFLVQPRTSNAMSVEDTQTEWTEAEAPFHKVATITIPKQVFATPERDALAENLSFNPWHALPEHRPLGSVNRVRRVVYKAISTLRRELNNVSLKEPTEWVEPATVADTIGEKANSLV
jgi:hypothetical protein